MKTRIILFFLLLSSLIHSQGYFNSYKLDIMDQIAKKEKFNSVKNILSKEGFELKTNNKKSDGRDYYYFRNSDFGFALFYSTDGSLITILVRPSPQEFYELENKLKTSNFKIISTEKQKNDNGVLVEINKWAKSDCPYHIITDHTDFVISFVSSISSEY